ncbi:DNA repair protein RecO [Aureimonas fodinaquatilis]|uniref:DNA repair protein RecO n=1 Tax=Aureimonas fodinaquatilis TaxID=2565783 RepID=A0A5B0DXE7_9HYPH|nr:DNA repair protein RecO [Aureimonas fodinaquatilis]KAA0971028.1 DNA repair protein RecO [Aureimonas fodinaquatilis]
MEWREEAIVLGIRRHGETSVVAELMTRSRGRHLGLVQGGRSRAQRPVLQPGNLVEARWRARLDEHLGSLTVEPVQLRSAGLMESAIALHAVQLLAAHIRLLPERDPHERLYDACQAILSQLQACEAVLRPQSASADHVEEAALIGHMMLRFELALLEEMGIGLDLEVCALSGATTGLSYVSPKTGRAVTAAAGAPWADKLLPLPAFLVQDSGCTVVELQSGYALTGHFLMRNIWEPRGINPPDSRYGFLSALVRYLEVRMAGPAANAQPHPVDGTAA